MDRKAVSLYLLGALSGAIAMFTIQGQELNRLYLVSAKSNIIIEDLKAENARLYVQLHNPSQTLIETIRVECTVAGGNERVAEAGSKYAKEQLAFLIGRELDVLLRHPEIPEQILNGQLFTADGRNYRLRVQLVVLGETLYVRIRANPIP
ncbi:MAG: hypothetical protein OWQ59_03765 [Alicyclobacillaceae bacterium]|jgi:hypothetical protein|uniref:hypothetical protein n=1 Tax=Alicyclobacillus sp. SP_1 TaxID=2942475 RepID=UPI0021570C08|nr:hypothetical protein [Alicyclobacillus sp. SP_1]MCY0887555.1 hypothetical protein [Alicyclobacillaceae bacterium]MCY0895084.1 hypothetical protein [Alicyclobacillaceae bacterium]